MLALEAIDLSGPNLQIGGRGGETTERTALFRTALFRVRAGDASLLKSKSHGVVADKQKPSRLNANSRNHAAALHSLDGSAPSTHPFQQLHQRPRRLCPDAQPVSYPLDIPLHLLLLLRLAPLRPEHFRRHWQSRRPDQSRDRVVLAQFLQWPRITTLRSVDGDDVVVWAVALTVSREPEADGHGAGRRWERRARREE